MVAGQLPVELSFKPLPGFVILAGRTVAVAAGTEYDSRFVSLLAAIDVNAVSFGTTADNGPHYFPVV